jgi:hypothetical protein
MSGVGVGKGADLMRFCSEMRVIAGAHSDNILKVAEVVADQ